MEKWQKLSQNYHQILPLNKSSIHIYEQSSWWSKYTEANFCIKTPPVGIQWNHFTMIRKELASFSFRVEPFLEGRQIILRDLSPSILYQSPFNNLSKMIPLSTHMECFDAKVSFGLLTLSGAVYVYIKKTCLYNVDPLKPHVYIVKLGFTGVYIIFHISAQKHRLWVCVRTASPRRF